jgi:hypothetical protein
MRIFNSTEGASPPAADTTADVVGHSGRSTPFGLLSVPLLKEQRMIGNESLGDVISRLGSG